MHIGMSEKELLSRNNRNRRIFEIILYHGSNATVDYPKLIRQNHYLDFGFGFCTTTNRDQAVNFARKVTDRRKTGAATLNIYLVDGAVAFRECGLLRFDSPDETGIRNGNIPAIPAF